MPKASTRSATQVQSDRRYVESLPVGELRSLARQGFWGPMKGVSKARKAELVEFVLKHTDVVGPSVDAVPSYALPPPPPPVQPASGPSHTGLTPSQAAAVAAAAMDPDRVRAMCMPLMHGVPPPKIPGKTPAQQALRHQREWAQIEAALDLEDEVYSHGSSGDWDDDEEDEGEGAVERARQKQDFHDETERRGHARVDEYWRRTDEVAKFEMALLAKGGMPPAVIEE